MNVMHSFTIGFRLLVASITALASSAILAGPPDIEKAIKAWAESDNLPPYRYALVDLNGDSKLDAVVLVEGLEYCGSGGCNMAIFKGTAQGFQLVSTSSITREPILVLSEVRHGWHTLAVLASGGSVASGQRLMRFSGTKYPSNPSVQGRARSKDLSNAKTLQLK